MEQRIVADTADFLRDYVRTGGGDVEWLFEVLQRSKQTLAVIM